MLKKRLITAIILLVIVVCVIYLLPQMVFQVVAGIVLLAAAWEWGGLLGGQFNCTSIKTLLVIVVALAYLNTLYSIPLFWAFVSAAIMVVWGLIAVICYSCGAKPAGFQHPLLKALACLLLIAPTMAGLVALRAAPHGAGLVFFALTLAFVNDSAAYFAGRWIGRTPLTRLVSPKKTWEGAICGILAGIVWSTLVTVVFWPQTFSILLMAVIAIPTLIAAVIGDLFISVLKRQINMKDTGTLLPGHGGLLDRIDAVIMAIPVFALVALLARVI